MTTTSEHAALRAIVVVPPDSSAEQQSSIRLLRELGHHVSPAESTEDAIGLIQSAHTDLLVIDLPNESDRRQLFHGLSTLPARQRPKRVAVFSDRLDEYVHTLRNAPEAKVHVFLKPLHLHGLLNILKDIKTRRAAQTV